MTDTSTTARWTLRDLPCAARLTLAAFLISVGIGYFSALVQLHFQHAKAGELMPTAEDAIDKFTMKRGKSQIEILLEETDEAKPFTGGGQMSAAFTKRSTGWRRAIDRKCSEMMGGQDKEPNDEDLKKAEEAVRKERNGERLAVLAWLRDESAQDAFTRDRFNLPDELKTQPITKKYLVEDDNSCVKIKSLWDDRCVRCHSPGGDPKAEQFPLETFEQIAKHNKAGSSSGMSLTKLAQTTHVHLLGFSILYGLTGLILALTTLPAFIRLPLAPLPLVVQVIDISFWWLARMDAPYGPMFARWIPITGAVVGASLGLHIILSLFSLFGWRGRAILVLLLLGAGYTGHVVKQQVIDPHIASEREAITSQK